MNCSGRYSVLLIAVGCLSYKPHCRFFLLHFHTKTCMHRSTHLGGLCSLCHKRQPSVARAAAAPVSVPVPAPGPLAAPGPMAVPVLAVSVCGAPNAAHIPVRAETDKVIS